MAKLLINREKGLKVFYGSASITSADSCATILNKIKKSMQEFEFYQIGMNSNANKIQYNNNDINMWSLNRLTVQHAK